MNSTLSASSTPAYHRLYRDPHAQSGRKDQNLRPRKMVTNHDLAIRISKFQMVVKSSREAQVFLKNRIEGIPRSLIRIFLLDLRNLKRRIQYGFSRLLIKSCHLTFEIQNDGKSQRDVLILLKNSIKGFQKPMFTILQSDFRNSRCLSQFGNDKFEKRLNYDQNWYIEVFEVYDHDLDIMHSKL